MVKEINSTKKSFWQTNDIQGINISENLNDKFNDITMKASLNDKINKSTTHSNIMNTIPQIKLIGTDFTESIYDPRKFKNCLQYFEDKHINPKKLIFKFHNGKTNKIGFSLDHEGIFSRLLKKAEAQTEASGTFNKDKIPVLSLEDSKFTKLHWYYLVDILIYDYLLLKLYDSKTSGVFDTSLLRVSNTILNYLTRIFISPEIRTVYNDCCDFIIMNVFEDNMELGLKWKIHFTDTIYTDLQENIYALRKVVEEIQYNMSVKINPGILMKSLKKKTIEEIISQLHFTNIEILDVLYYMYNTASKFINIIHPLEQWMITYPDLEQRYPDLFKDENGDFLSEDEFNKTLYSKHKMTKLYHIFSDMEYDTEVHTLVYLIYSLYIFLRYINDGKTPNNSYRIDVETLIKTQDKTLKSKWDMSKLNVDSIPSLIVWINKVQKHIQERCPNYMDFLNLPKSTMSFDQILVDGKMTLIPTGTIIQPDLNKVMNIHAYQDKEVANTNVALITRNHPELYKINGKTLLEIREAQGFFDKPDVSSSVSQSKKTSPVIKPSITQTAQNLKTKVVQTAQNLKSKVFKDPVVQVKSNEMTSTHTNPKEVVQRSSVKVVFSMNNQEEFDMSKDRTDDPDQDGDNLINDILSNLSTQDSHVSRLEEVDEDFDLDTIQPEIMDSEPQDGAIRISTRLNI